MQIKYKLKHKKTGEVLTDLKGYLLDNDGNAKTAILPNNTKVDCSNYIFCRFLEKIDGKDIYHGDKAIIDIAVYDYGSAEEYKYRRLEGEFLELYEEGLYYFVVDYGTNKEDVVVYNASRTKIIELY